MRTLIRALKTRELRNKILFVIFLIIIFRIGSSIPTPGVDYTAVRACTTLQQANPTENFVGLVNLFSGGALLQLSIFALAALFIGVILRRPFILMTTWFTRQVDSTKVY